MCCWRRLTAMRSSTPFSSTSQCASPPRLRALEAAHRRARHQAVAVHAHEALAELLLEPGQRFLDQVLARRGAHRHVLELGLEVDHVRDRDQVDLAALLGREMRARRARDLAQRLRRAAPRARAPAPPSGARAGSASTGSRPRAPRRRGSRRRRRRWRTPPPAAARAAAGAARPRCRPSPACGCRAAPRPRARAASSSSAARPFAASPATTSGSSPRAVGEQIAQALSAPAPRRPRSAPARPRFASCAQPVTHDTRS